MKKTILVTILVVAMLLATIGSVRAASVAPENVTVKKGATVTVTVKADKPGKGAQFDIEFNPTELKYTGATSAEGLTVKPSDSIIKDGKGTGTILAYDAQGNGTTTDTVTLTFEALKDTDATSVKVTNFVCGDEEVATVGATTVKVEKVEPTTPDKPSKPSKPSKPTDIHGNEITENPKTGTPIYVAVVAVIVIAAGAVLAIRKNK